MSIKYLKKQNELSIPSTFFEIGLALQLNRITSKEVMKYIAISKLNKVITQIESNKDYEKWDDSHISSGDRLKAALETHNISQACLARKLNVKSQKINDLIKGRITLTISWAKKIAKVLDVNYKIFL